MALMQSAVVALITISTPQMAPKLPNTGVITLAQGTDKFPGGVEHAPMPGGQTVAPSMSVPAPLPEMQPAPVASPPPEAADNQPSHGAENPPETSTKKKMMKRKMLAPDANRRRYYKSTRPAPKPYPTPGTGGDDSIPGGVEHVPGGGQNAP